MKRKYISGLACIAILALIIACATTGPGGKKDLIFISSAQEVGLGQSFDSTVRAESKVLATAQWQNYFNNIGQRIVAVCDRKDIKYTFTVIESDDVNAFATPGGYVYIYTGLLRIMDNEAQLAAVTAHEISHIVARHSIKRLQQVLGIALLQEIVLGESSSEALQTAINIGLTVALQGYSRSNEREADKFGVYYMELAGFNPAGAVELFGHLKEISGEHGTNFFENMLASHPETDERINNVTEQMATYSGDVVKRDKGRAKYQQMKSLLPPPAPKTDK
jgi:predicted Zn-dependent protease